MKSPLSLLLVCFACTFGLGCVTDTDTDAERALLSERGDAEISLLSAPEASLVRGENQLELTVLDPGSQARRTGLTIEATSFMPAMGHGGPDITPAREIEPGVYRFDRVTLPMAGLWEVRFSLQGEITDQLTIRAEIQ